MTSGTSLEEDASFPGRDREFWFGDDIDLGSPFLYSMLSDERRVPGPKGVTPAVCDGVRENELTDEEWENVTKVILGFRT